MVNELAVLQALRLKGRADARVIAGCTGASEADAQAAIQDLVVHGLATGGVAVRLTPEGRARLDELTRAERADVDGPGLEAVYGDFHRVNDALKQVVTSWQLIDSDTPNDHTDPDYDSAVVARLLDEVDTAFRPLLERAIALVPRLDSYRARFDYAVEQLRAGDTAWIAKPVADSYHTVWFELHEELIGLLGRTRADEARAGRAL